MPRELLVVADAQALAREAERRVLAVAEAARSARGVFHLALSGGSTPRALYRRLAALPRERFDAWHVWWGDERFVPHEHPDSNYRMAREELLDALELPPERVHPVPTQLSDPQAAARAYAQALADALGDPPALDLVLLGMGDDGHTASLFPGDAALEERTAPVAAAFPEHAPYARVTLTLPALAAARAVLFLVTGADKRPALARVLAGDAEPPAARVRPASGELVWLLDRAAEPAGRS